MHFLVVFRVFELLSWLLFKELFLSTNKMLFNRCVPWLWTCKCVLFYRTADKESLTAELNKLQQSYRNVKGDLSSKVDQLSQSEANRRSAEEKVRQLTVHQNSVVRRTVQLRRKCWLAIKFNFPWISWGLRITWASILYSYVHNMTFAFLHWHGHL